MDNEVLKEIPSSLKQLARLIVRGFYSIEHTIVVDMLVRNPCIKEDDLVEFLKLERKQLRTIIAQLKNDKFIKVRLRMETGPDGKASRQNYYYINYKVFVNVVKYKLDHMRRKIETEERDNTSRASFKCPSCKKSFTDLEANQLFDFQSQEFRCTFCNTAVEEDASALPKQDSRLLVAKFNEEIEPLYNILREVEDIKLAPELLDPEPTDLSNLKRDGKPARSSAARNENQTWSGEATRHKDYNMEQDVTISFNDEAKAAETIAAKERPIWMTESTVVVPEVKEEPITPFPTVVTTAPRNFNSANQDDIMMALLTHEKKGGGAVSMPVIPGVGTDSDTSESEEEAVAARAIETVGEMEDEDEEEEVAIVAIGDLRVPLNEVTPDLIAKMTPMEKEAFIQLSQEMYSTMYD